MKAPSVFVATSNNGGLRPEQVADLCVNRLLSISDTAPPEIAAQAHAFRQQMFAAVLHYVKLAVSEDRASMCLKLERAGRRDIADLVRNL